MNSSVMQYFVRGLTQAQLPILNLLLFALAPVAIPPSQGELDYHSEIPTLHYPSFCSTFKF